MDLIHPIVRRFLSDLLSYADLAKGGPLNSTAVRSGVTSRVEVVRERAYLCARVAEDNKAKDIVVLDMRGVTPLYDYLVLATGSAAPGVGFT